MRRIVIVVALVVATFSQAPGVSAADQSPRADLEGTSIAAADVGRYFCHDRAFPAIHCYRTAAALERALAGKGAAVTAQTGGVTAAAIPAGTYVTIYSAPSYAGSYMYVTQNYDTLAIVGWNDRIRSYKAKNALLGTFWTDWFANGARQDFCCNSQVPYLTATFDQQITSVYRR
jgi:hypothetical protein